MHFNTFVFASAAIALVHASTGVVGKFANGTATAIPTFTDNSTNVETMPVIDPTSVFLPTTTTQTPLVITTVETMTLTYTLGSEGSSSVVTTVVETTSTITMTATMYITVTESDDAQSTETFPDAGIYPTLDPTAIGSGNDTFSLYPTATSSDDYAFPTENPALTTNEESIPTADPTAAVPEYSATATFDTTSDDFSITGPATVTVTDYITTTETVTLPPAETGVDVSSPSDGSFFQSTDGSSLGGDSGCVSTVTTTVAELSTITESPSPTSTDNLPIDPTAVPSYGCGNGTDPTTGYPTASSGFWTLYRRARPTTMLENE